MKFWETHAKEMRRARLLQAAAIVYTIPAVPTAIQAVKKAFELEELVNAQLSKESQAPKGRNGDDEHRTK